MPCALLYRVISSHKMTIKGIKMLSSDYNNLNKAIDLDNAIDDGRFSKIVNYAKEKFGMDNVTYFSPSIKGHSYLHPYLESTYSSEWEQRYRERGYMYIDPVFKLGCAEVKPIDWQDIPRDDIVVARFFKEAEEYQVGTQGITVPIRIPNSPLGALLTMTNSMGNSEWKSHKNHIIGDVMLFAAQYHSKIYDKTRKNQMKPLLTKRELEVVSWIAEGRTVDDTASIMNLSRDTIKAHLEVIRQKTGALNTVHAITILYRHGIFC